MTDIHIPPAALEAGAKASHEEFNRIVLETNPDWQIRTWDELDGYEKEEARAELRAAFLAMIEAWPMVNTDAVRCGTLILHLPKEPHNDKS